MRLSETSARPSIYTDPIEVSPENDSLPELVKEIEAGKVATLFILGSNPVFTAPADLQFAQQLLKVPLRIHFGLYDDETAEICHWHIPQTHFLESWSDARAYDGTVGIVQPLIAPLYHGHSLHEALALLTGDIGKSDHDLVRDYWRTQHSQPFRDADFESFWETTLHDGVMAGTALPAVSPKLSLDYGKLPDPPALNQQAIEVVFRPDPTIGDGRWANNAWLQELPKPFAKITWDNVVALSPATAWRLGLTTGDVVNLDHRRLESQRPGCGYAGPRRQFRDRHAGLWAQARRPCGHRLRPEWLSPAHLVGTRRSQTAFRSKRAAEIICLPKRRFIIPIDRNISKSKKKAKMLLRATSCASPRSRNFVKIRNLPRIPTKMPPGISRSISRTSTKAMPGACPST